METIYKFTNESFRFYESTTQSIDTAIATEMEKIKARYNVEEESYVNEKLSENPVVCERRPSNRSGSEGSSSPRDPIKEQRAESCRRSRINNKIKKAKLKYRHSYITTKLAQNASALQLIREVIAHAETRVRNSACGEDGLAKLRSAIGFNHLEMINLTELACQLGNGPDNN